MKNEIKWRKEFAIVVPVFFLVGFVICCLAAFFSYENVIYGFWYNSAVTENQGAYALNGGIMGGYTFSALLCGIMFTVHALGKTKTCAKVALTVFFVVPLFLVATGVVYLIPYFIYNLIKLIFLKYKSKNSFGANNAHTYNYTVNANNVPVRANSYASYSGTYYVKNNVQQSHTNSQPRDNNKSAFVHMYSEEDSSAHADISNADKKEKLSENKESRCTDLSIEDMEIYEKPYEKPSESFMQWEKKLEEESEDENLLEQLSKQLNEDLNEDSSEPPQEKPNEHCAEAENYLTIESPTQNEDILSKPIVPQVIKSGRYTYIDPDNPYGDGF